MSIFTSVHSWFSHWYSWVTHVMSLSATYEEGRQYAISQLEDGITLEELQHDFDIHSGFNGMTPFDRGVQSVLFEKHQQLSTVEKQLLAEISDTPLSLYLTSTEANELLQCVEKGIQLCIAHQHTQELTPNDVIWYTDKCNVLIGIKQKLKAIVTNSSTGHE